MKIKKIKNQADVEKFIESWEVVFQRKFDKSTYSWLFSENNNLYGCFDGTSLVAGYCLLNVEALINKQRKKGVLSNNIFINGFKYKKMGLFGELTEYALSDMADKGSVFAFGFPNEKAIKPYVRSGWVQSDSLPFYEFKIKQLSVVEKSPFKFKWLVSDEVCGLRDISELMNKKYDKYSFSLLKSPEFLEWRFVHNPRWEYDVCCIYNHDILEGFFVSKYFLEKKRVHIIDYYFPNDEVLQTSLVRIYKKYILEKALEVECVDAWCAAGDQVVFEQAGFSKSVDSSYVIFKNLSKEGLSIGDIPHLTLADNEVF